MADINPSRSPIALYINELSTTKESKIVGLGTNINLLIGMLNEATTMENSLLTVQAVKRKLPHDPAIPGIYPPKFKIMSKQK